MPMKVEKYQRCVLNEKKKLRSILHKLAAC